VGTSKTSFTGLVVDEKGSRAQGSCIHYTFLADPKDAKGRKQFVMGVMRQNKDATACDSAASFQRICHWFFWDGKCPHTKCHYVHERPSDAQMHGASMGHMVGKGVSVCCVDASGAPRGAVGT
jgi:hypothetical protein